MIRFAMAAVVSGMVCACAPDASDQDRMAIKLCWKDQERKSLTPAEQRFIAGACESMEAKYREKHGRIP